MKRYIVFYIANGWSDENATLEIDNDFDDWLDAVSCVAYCDRVMLDTVTRRIYSDADDEIHDTYNKFLWYMQKDKTPTLWAYENELARMATGDE